MVIARNISNKKLMDFLTSISTDDPIVLEGMQHYFVTGSRRYQCELPESDLNIVVHPSLWERKFAGIELSYEEDDTTRWVDPDSCSYNVTIPGKDLLYCIIVPINEHEYLRWKYATQWMMQLISCDKIFARLCRVKDTRLSIFEAFLAMYV